MNKKDFLSVAKRQTELRKWKPKEKQVKLLKNRQTSDEFIAQGGKCIKGEPLKFDLARELRRTGFLYQSIGQ